MASLFALGVMSLVWMAVVAGLIAFEKLIPSRRAATYVTAGDPARTRRPLDRRP
jgi:predicted metal-binding membrane protein